MNVETPLIEQFLSFFLCGVVISVFYEPLRIIRVIVPHGSFAVGAEDTLFLSLSGVVLFGYSMQVGNGNFRLFYLLFAALGAIIYFLTVGRLLRKFYISIISVFKKATSFIFKLICRIFKKPIVLFAHKCKTVFVKINEIKLRSIKKFQLSLKKNSKMMYNRKKKGSVQLGGKTAIKGKVKKE